MKADSLSNKAYTLIRRKILSNQIPGDTRLKEEEWSKKTGVSRIALREALTRLLGEGLVLMGEKGGFYVKAMTRQDVIHLREMREILELGAIRLAIKKMGKEQFKRLDKICEDFSNMAKENYFNGALEADMKFHETLIELAENPMLLQIYTQSHIPLFHQRLGKTQVSYDDYEQTDTEHRQLVKALRDQDLEAAEKTLIQHFTRGESVVLDLD